MILDDLKLDNILPNSIKNGAEVQNISSSLDKEIQLINSSIPGLSIYSAIDTLPMDIVQMLAWQFNVNSEDKGWLLTATDEEKRELVKNSIRLHRTKGTRYAIEGALKSVGFDGAIEEWFEYDGNPYHFKIRITSYKGLDEAKLRRLRGLVKEYKNARSFLEDLAFISTVSSDIPKIGASYYSAAKVNLYPYIDNNLDVLYNLRAGVSFQTTAKITLFPLINNADESVFIDNYSIITTNTIEI